MTRKLLTLGLLALAMAVPVARAQSAAAPGASAPAAPLVDPASIQALKDMGEQLQALKRFSVSAEMTGERVLADGQKLQHTASARVDVARPDRLRVSMRSPRSQRQVYFDGKTVTLFSPQQNAYSSVAVSDTLAGLVQRLQTRFGVDTPLSDLFIWGTPEAPLDQIESAMFAGQDFIGNDLCNHYAFRQGKIDWQVWISADDKPLPRKLVITSRTDEARPQSVSLISWKLNPGFNDSVFRFVPPAGAVQAELIERKTK